MYQVLPEIERLLPEPVDLPRTSRDPEWVECVSPVQYVPHTFAKQQGQVVRVRDVPLYVLSQIRDPEGFLVGSVRVLEVAYSTRFIRDSLKPKTDCTTTSLFNT